MTKNLSKEECRKLLEEANKLIFVKQYSEAEKVLLDILASEEGAKNLLVHLRRIELAAKFGKLNQVREFHLKKIEKEPQSVIHELCICLTEQYGEMIPPSESIAKFQGFIKTYGPNATAYYGIAFSLEQQSNFDRAIYNYEKSISIDPDWYPSYFGLSQIYYQKGDEKLGDHYFYLFEKAAPYNVYGNFETHRRLCQDFLEESRFVEAEVAIQTLSEWWMENRGFCPPEIQIYENLSTAKISESIGDKVQAESRINHAKVVAMQLLEEESVKEGVLFFVAKLLEEFGEISLSFEYYKKLFRTSANNPVVIQKVGSQFLAMGEYQMAKELFEEAYNIYPNKPEIRFGLLVSKLKIASVNVEEYLIGRERVRQLLDSGGDRVELLALLHSLTARFQEDSDIQCHMGDIYLKLGNLERATKHFEKMYLYDPKNRSVAIKFADFNMQHGDAEKALKILDEAVKPSEESLPKDLQAEILWLKARYYSRKEDYQISLDLLRKVLEIDPWNISYLVQEILCLTALSKLKDDLPTVKELATALLEDRSSNVDWRGFDQKTHLSIEQHIYDLAYSRSKLRYLYANGSADSLQILVACAEKHNAAQGIYDFLRLLNTNFDSPNIYRTLGILFRELWQLEIAIMWFEQTLRHPTLGTELQRTTYTDLADCYIWKNINLDKAIEYAKLALELGDQSKQPFLVLAHAYLKKGQIRQAKVYLNQTDKDAIEAIYLNGLIHYRNGAQEMANQIWKPLLTFRSENIRLHNIKQEILKFYFDKVPYQDYQDYLKAQ